MRAVLCACDISVRVGVHFWDVQLRAACGAPAARRATDTSDLRASRRTCDVRVNERCKRHTDTTHSPPHTCVDSAHMHTLDPHAVHLRRLPFVPFPRRRGFKVTSQTLSALSTLGPANRPHSWPLTFCSSFCSRGGSSGLFSGLFEVSVCWRIWSVRLLFKEISSAVLKLTQGKVGTMILFCPPPLGGGLRILCVCVMRGTCVYFECTCRTAASRPLASSSKTRPSGPNMGNHDKRAMTSNVKGPCGNAHKAARRTRV